MQAPCLRCIQWIHEYDGVERFDRLFLHFALRRHTKSEVRAIWNPLVQLDDFADCTMDTRVREYDVTFDLIASSFTYPFGVIPEVRNELSGIHLYNETILHTAQWIPACVSMTVL